MRKLLLALVLTLSISGVGLPASVSATGSETISGYAYTWTDKHYKNPRRVTNPALAGPEVVFKSTAHPVGTKLGTNNCSADAFMTPAQFIYGTIWNPIAYFSVPTTFCISTASNHSSGTFSGTLAWD